MKYQTGEEIKVGDFVLIESGVTPAIVEVIIDTPELLKDFELDEYGLFLKAKPFGSVYWSIADEDIILFVSRSNENLHD